MTKLKWSQHHNLKFNNPIHWFFNIFEHLVSYYIFRNQKLQRVKFINFMSLNIANPLQ